MAPECQKDIPVAQLDGTFGPERPLIRCDVHRHRQLPRTSVVPADVHKGSPIRTRIGVWVAFPILLRLRGPPACSGNRDKAALLPADQCFVTSILVPTPKNEKGTPFGCLSDGREKIGTYDPRVIGSNLILGSGERIRTSDLRVMSLNLISCT